MDAAVGIQLPRPVRAPAAAVARRIGLAIGLVLFVALVVRFGRDGYVDGNGDGISLLDALYYASVTVTTTGYGDITAVSDGARAATILLITPARILFLILVVSTTVEVLTEQSRELVARRRWRKNVQNHTVICGFGATGQAAAADLLARGVDRESIVVVDSDPAEIERANRDGFVGIVGDATRTEVLHEASIETASSVIVSPNRDDTAVLVTLTARELNPDAHIVTGGRERENLHLLRQGGADEVIDATAAVGRMLGLGARNPGAVRVLDDLLDAGGGLILVETKPDVIDGTACIPAGANLVAIVRDGERLPPDAVRTSRIRPDDRLIVLNDSLPDD